MTSNYADLTELIADLRRAGQLAESQIDAMLDNVATQIEAEAISTVPVRTGKLRGSIRVWRQLLHKVIGPDVNAAEYGPYLEYGTASRGEFGGSPYVIKPKNASTLRFRVGNKVVFAKSVTHPGIAPQPYMRPALMHWVDSLGPDAAKVGVSLIVGPNR